MSQEQFERETRYRAALSIARTMLARGLITRPEYDRIATVLARKYRPVFGAL